MKDNKEKGLFKDHLDLVMLKLNDDGTIKSEEVADLMASLEMKDAHDIEHGIITKEEARDPETVIERIWDVIQTLNQSGFCSAVVDNGTKVVTLMKDYDDRLCFMDTTVHRKLIALNKDNEKTDD